MGAPPQLPAPSRQATLANPPCTVSPGQYLGFPAVSACFAKLIGEAGMSSFSWLDYAESDRRAAMDVIDLFRDQDTRDELGIATVRDTFSDILFPGTSAIQTRARYFLIIPWIYRRLEKAKVESAEIALRARKEELALIDALVASDDPKGTIGLRARKTLKRLPSAVYWQGLGRLGIRTFRGARDQYHRSLDRFHSRTGGTMRNDDGEVVEAGRTRNWDVGLPQQPDGFPKVCSLALTHQEAEYLRDRITHAAPRSLLAYLVNNTSDAPDVDFPWKHPAVASLPDYVAEPLREAQNFSELMYGANLLYNIMLAELRKDKESVELYKSWLAEWREDIKRNWTRYQRWDRGQFWSTVIRGGGRIPPRTRFFVDAWLDLLLRSPTLDPARSEAARALVGDRERELKRGLARVDGGRSLEIWGGAAGTARMDYRWNAVVKQIITDIHEGLARADA